MKTKHLFYAAGLAAMMAACANEDIVLDAPQLPVDGTRATVENVKLNFTNGVESRLTFGANGYAWEATDTIGALLMDAPIPGASRTAPWTQKYDLQNYVNTSYPFTYDSAEATWGCIGKMLEGNYFFAFPWSSYDGGRTVNHTLFNQQQTGVAGKAVAQSYADNQFFIGYAQIKAGTQANETLEDVVMTDALGAMQFQLINNTGKTIHVYKAVLNNVPGAVTFKPVYSDTDGDEFDVMEYVENEVFTEEYTRDMALRKVVSPASLGSGAQLFINGTDAERAIAAGGKGYLLIMSAPLNEDAVKAATLTIYTDEGQFTVADLTNDLNSETVEEVKPGKSTTYEVNIEELSETTGMAVYSEEDLLKLIEWNIKRNAAADLVATLKNDITLTKEAIDLLKTNSNLKLEVNGVYTENEGTENEAEYSYTVTLAKDLSSNVLDYNKLSINAEEVIVEGAIDLSAKTKANANNLTILEGATLNIKKAVDGAADGITIPEYITNNGTVNIAGVKVSGTCTFANNEKAIINVAANADVQVAITNEGIVNNNGYMASLTNNHEDAVVNLGEVAILDGVTNTKGTINAAKNSEVGGTNAADGLIICADNTVNIKLTTNNGKVAIVATEDVTEDMFDETGYNTLIINKEIKFKHATTGGINYVILRENGKLVADAKVDVSLTSLIVEGNATISTTVGGENQSTVTAANAEIKKGAVLTNNGILNVTSTDWVNKGKVVNNQTVKLNKSIYNVPAKYGEWQYKKPSEYTAAHTHTTAVGQAVTIENNSNVRLNDAIKTAQTNDGTGCGVAGTEEHVNENEYVKTLTLINSVVDMDIEFKVGSADKTNADYKAALAKAVVLKNGAQIVDLTPSMNVEMTKLTVINWGRIAGTKKTAIAKVDELVVESGATFDIVDGYLEIDVTAQKGFGCQYITIENGASINGEIVAKDANGNYLYWDANLGEWIDTPANNSSNVTLSASATIDDLNKALENENVKIVELEKPLEVTSDVVIDLNDKALFPKNADSRAAGVKGTVFTVAENGKLTLKNGQVGNGDENGDSSTYQIVNNGKLIMEYVIVEGAVSNVGNLTMKGCYVHTQAENQNALVSGYNNVDSECYLTLTGCTLISDKHAAAKLQNNNTENNQTSLKKGLYAVSGTTFDGNEDIEDLCLASANLNWGEGNTLKHDVVLLFDNYVSTVNNKNTKEGPLKCTWSEIFPEVEE